MGKYHFDPEPMARMCAIECGLVKEKENGDGWDMETFNLFWEEFSDMMARETEQMKEMQRREKADFFKRNREAIAISVATTILMRIALHWLGL